MITRNEDNNDDKLKPRIHNTNIKKRYFYCQRMHRYLLMYKIQFNIFGRFYCTNVFFNFRKISNVGLSVNIKAIQA